MTIHIIGIDDGRTPRLSSEALQAIEGEHLFSGGARHYEIVRPLLPDEHRWIPVAVPLAPVMEAYRQHPSVVVFASGDPLFYGFANTILREMPEADVRVYPHFHSLQQLAHRLVMPYHDMHVVSLTGRPWQRFDEALIEGYEMIGVLTDQRAHTPATIAARMLEYGYDNYTVCVGELLGNDDGETISRLTLAEAAGRRFAYPNCLILQRTHRRPRPFGIPESAFELLDGRAKMITKMPVRLLSLSLLGLRERRVLWDIGFCTGSVSIEARLQFPHLQIVAFERRAAGEELMRDNARRFGAPGIETVIGDFLDADPAAYPAPDALFIGGHGGRLNEMLSRLRTVIDPAGIIVFNSVSAESRQSFIDALQPNGFELSRCIRMQVDDFNPIDVMSATLAK